MSRLRSLLALVLFASCASMTFACNRVRVDDVQGPDGHAWKKISCRHMDQRCYKTALAMCPNGYFFRRAGESGPTLVYDTEEGSQVVQPAPGAPAVGRNATRLPPQSEWDSGMYSRQRGTLLVTCAGPIAEND